MASSKDKDNLASHPLKREDNVPVASPSRRPRRPARHRSPSPLSSSHSYDSYDSFTSSSRSPSPRSRHSRRSRRDRSPSPSRRRHHRNRRSSRSRSRSSSWSDSQSRSRSRSRSYSRSGSASASPSSSRSRSRSPSSFSSRSYSPQDHRRNRSPSWRGGRREPYRSRAWTPSRSRSPRGHRPRGTRYPDSPDDRAYPAPPRADGDGRRGRPWRPRTTAAPWRRDRGLKRKHSPARLMPTVFVTKLAQKVRRDDVADLFARAGRVRDVRMVTDRMTSRHKGAAYVEFDDRDAVSAAVGLSGSLLCGVAVEIRAWVDGSRDDWWGVRNARGAPPDTEPEVNEDGAPATVGWSSRRPMHRRNRAGGGPDLRVMEGGGPSEVGKGVNEPTELVSIEELKQLLNPKKLTIAPYAIAVAQMLARSGDGDVANGKRVGARDAGRILDRVPLPVAVKAEAATRVFVDGFARGTRAEQLREVFKKFGEVMWCEMEPSANSRGNGICVVEFANAATAQKAAEATRLELGGRALRVFGKRSDAGLEVRGEIDAGGEGGVSLNSTRRAMLMQQLSRGESVGGRKLQGDLDKLKTQPEASVSLILSNMFDPDAEDEGFENEVKVDVRDECAAQYGKVVHVSVEKESHGIVYVRFVNVADAAKARAALDGRWFGGKKISAGFVPDKDYVKRFPSCLVATDM